MSYRTSLLGLQAFIIVALVWELWQGNLSIGSIMMMFGAYIILSTIPKVNNDTT